MSITRIVASIHSTVGHGEEESIKDSATTPPLTHPTTDPFCVRAKVYTGKLREGKRTEGREGGPDGREKKGGRGTSSTLASKIGESILSARVSAAVVGTSGKIFCECI